MVMITTKARTSTNAPTAITTPRTTGADQGGVTSVTFVLLSVHRKRKSIDMITCIRTT